MPGDGKLVCHPSKTSFEGRKTRKYSTSSKTKSNIVNIKNINELKLNNNMFVSSVVYNNAEEYKHLILADNKNKAGIYVWTHRESSKKYIGSSVNLSRRLSYNPLGVLISIKQVKYIMLF